jgi:RNA polymerase sigma-70 factor (ECF subfamily)
MSDNNSFHDFIRRVRAGDDRAAAELVRRYELAIRGAVRVRLTDPQLGRLLDSVDICQSVLASFFARAAAGQYDLERPEDLLGLLVRMARNKLASQARKQQARPADALRADAGALDDLSAGLDPSRLVAGRDLLHEVRRRLSTAERRVADLRADGRSWPEVAAELGGTPEARRKQLSRALDRVSQELGLDEDGDEAI